MNKNEPITLIPRPVNPNENAELTGMRRQINELRYQLGMQQEQVKELEQAQHETMGSIATVKQAFRDRVDNIAKSYAIELGVVKDGVLWQFDEGNLQFVPRPMQASPNARPVVVSPPNDGEADKADTTH